MSNAPKESPEIPYHLIKARELIDWANTTLVSQFPDLRIDAYNATENARELGSWTHQRFSSAGNPILARAALSGALQDEFEAAYSTRVSVRFDGDDPEKMMTAKQVLDEQAIKIDAAADEYTPFIILDWDAPTGDPQVDEDPHSQRDPDEPRFYSNANYVFTGNRPAPTQR